MMGREEIFYIFWLSTITVSLSGGKGRPKIDRFDPGRSEGSKLSKPSDKYWTWEFSRGGRMPLFSESC